MTMSECMQFPNTWEEFKQWYGFEDVKMEKRDFADMVIYFCQKVSEMNISRKCKMELLGMITAIEIKHDELMPKWIPVSEALPKDMDRLLATIVRSDGSKRVRSGHYYKGLFSMDNGDVWNETDNEILAWMPLVEPYRGDR